MYLFAQQSLNLISQLSFSVKLNTRINVFSFNSKNKNKKNFRYEIYFCTTIRSFTDRFKILKLFWHAFQKIKRWFIKLINAEWKTNMIQRTLYIISYISAKRRSLKVFFCCKYDLFINQYKKLLYNNIQYLLTLAFANKIFWNINSFQNFWQL